MTDLSMSMFANSADYWKARAEAADAKVAETEKRQAQAFALLRQSYVTLAFAFKRLHESPRSRDGELCLDFQKVRAQIEAIFKDAGVKL